MGDAGSTALGDAMAGLTGLDVLVNGWDKMRSLRSGSWTCAEEGQKVDLRGTELAVPVARYLPLNSNILSELNLRYIGQG